MRASPGRAGRAEGGDGRWRRRAGFLLGCSAAALPVWMLVLALTLPTSFSARRWAVAWIGLDVLEAVSLGATAWLTVRRTRAVAPFAGASAAVLLADAWFDVVTARTGGDYAVAIAVALVVEVPLAALCAGIAWRSQGWDRPD